MSGSVKNIRVFVFGERVSVFNPFLICNFRSEVVGGRGVFFWIQRGVWLYPKLVCIWKYFELIW